MIARSNPIYGASTNWDKFGIKTTKSHKTPRFPRAAEGSTFFRPFLGCKRSLVRIQSSRPIYDNECENLHGSRIHREASRGLTASHAITREFTASHVSFGIKLGYVPLAKELRAGDLHSDSRRSVAAIQSFSRANTERRFSLRSIARALRFVLTVHRGIAGMALLELDNEFVRDERIALLGEITGKGKFDARGRLVALWLDCIERTQDVRTADEIDSVAGWFESSTGRFADLMVKARLAEPADSSQTPAIAGQYRVRGVGKRMQWLVDLREKRRLAASKGGKIRAAGAVRGPDGRYGGENEAETPAKLQPNAGPDPSKIQPEPGGTVTVSGTVPVSGTRAAKKKARAKKTEAQLPFGSEGLGTGAAGEGESGTVVSRAIGTYLDLWKERHGGRAPLTPKDRGLIKAAANEFGEARTTQLLEAFFEMPDAWANSKAHDVATFHMNLSKVAKFADTGRIMTRTETNRMDRSASNAQLIDQINRGEV